MMEELPETLVNGDVSDHVSVTDRGLAYGHGVFETIALFGGQPRFWNRHMARLQTGCDRLGISPVDEAQLRTEIETLLVSHGNDSRCVLKIIVTGGAGARGYRFDAETTPTRILQIYDWPAITPGAEGIRARVCSFRLADNPQLAGIKHLNRLEQVLARSEWSDPETREGLVLDQAGHVIEGTMSNLFLVKDGVLLTPDLHRCGVAGVTRSVILELGAHQGLSVKICHVSLDALLQADEVFVCNSLIDIWPVISIDGNSYPRGEVTAGLQSRLQGLDDEEHTWMA